MVNLGEDIGNSQWGTQVLEGSDWKVVQPITALTVLQSAWEAKDRATEKIRAGVRKVMDSNRNTLEKFSDIESQLSGLELRKGAILEEYLRGHTSSGHKVSEDIAKAMRFLWKMSSNPTQAPDLPSELVPDMSTDLQKWTKKVVGSIADIWAKWVTLATLPVLIPIKAWWRKLADMVRKKTPYTLGWDNLSESKALELSVDLYKNTAELDEYINALRDTPKNLEPVLVEVYSLLAWFKGLGDFIRSEEYLKVVQEYKIDDALSAGLIDTMYESMLSRISQSEIGLTWVIEHILTLMKTAPVVAQNLHTSWNKARDGQILHQIALATSQWVRNAWNAVQDLESLSLFSLGETQRATREIAAIPGENMKHSARLMIHQSKMTLTHQASMIDIAVEWGVARNELTTALDGLAKVNESIWFILPTWVPTPLLSTTQSTPRTNS